MSRKGRALFRDYVWGRQSLTQLAESEGRSHVWVKKQLDAAVPLPRALIPQRTSIAADMTFWGRGYGVLVFRSPTLKKNLWWTESLFEMPFVYGDGLRALQRQGWTITGAVIDGKRGVASVFEREGIPVQYCQFHQVKTVTKYLTRKPQTEAGKELRILVLTLKEETEAGFIAALNEWHEKWITFLDERSSAPHKKRGWDYTHRRIRSAYRSLKENLPRLFTYQKFPELGLPNTTNTLDGMFSQIKNRLAVHRGLRRDRRYKIIAEILSGKEKSDTRKFL
jgi:hypothetical protein